MAPDRPRRRIAEATLARLKRCRDIIDALIGDPAPESQADWPYVRLRAALAIVALLRASRTPVP
jgi:hypothetical protein